MTGTNAGHGFADYVLWDKNGLPLAVLEAKRASKDAHAGLDAAGAALPKSLAERTFATRVGLLGAAQQQMPDDAYTSDLAARLARQVSEWPEANFSVRPHLETVRAYGHAEAWKALGLEASAQVGAALAPLAALAAGKGAEESQRFDLLALQAQLTALSGSAPACANSSR